MTSLPNKNDENSCEGRKKSKARWEILRSAIVDKKIIASGDSAFSQSVRCIDAFELFARKQCNCLSKSDQSSIRNKKSQCLWYAYTCNDFSKSATVWVQHFGPGVNLKDVTSFNNTGNICIWPAEEVLAYYCLLHSDKFNFKSVVELGGGNSCLAGMCVALNSRFPQVLLTDGNAKCIDSLKKTIDMNTKSASNAKVTASLLRWDKLNTYKQHQNSFDLVLCADCLFFDDYRQNLVDTIHYVLKPSGVALVFAPRRGKTLEQFVELCKEKFSNVLQSERYCQLITNKHEEKCLKDDSYNPDIHFPILVELFK